MSTLEDLKNYCLRAIRGEFETNKVEKKSFLDVTVDYGKSEFVKSITAIANTPPDPVIPYGLLIVGVQDDRILNNLSRWARDDNEYQNLVKTYCYPMIVFSFYRLEHEGQCFGTFMIPNSQERPYLIIKDLVHDNRIYLARGQIYIREGSETKVALKEEIHRYIISDFSYRIEKSLDELSSKDVQIANVKFLPEDVSVSSEIMSKIRDHLWKNVVEVRKILRGIS